MTLLYPITGTRHLLISEMEVGFGWPACCMFTALEGYIQGLSVSWERFSHEVRRRAEEREGLMHWQGEFLYVWKAFKWRVLCDFVSGVVISIKARNTFPITGKMLVCGYCKSIDASDADLNDCFVWGSALHSARFKTSLGKNRSVVAKVLMC